MSQRLTITIGTGKAAKTFKTVKAAKKFADKSGGKLTIKVA